MQELTPCSHTPNFYDHCIYKDYIFEWLVTLLTVAYSRNFYSSLSSLGSNLYSFFSMETSGIYLWKKPAAPDCEG
jgi:hypothetical protein